jgi:hypothetical protein
MFGQRLEVRGPGGVYGPVDFKTPTQPFEEFLFAFFFGRFDGVVDAGEPDSFFDKVSDLLEPVVSQKRMAVAAVAVKD